MTTSSPVARPGRVSGNREPPSRVIRWLLTGTPHRERGDGKSIRYDAAGSPAMPRARVKDLSSHLVSTRPAWPEVRASSRCGFAPGRSGAFRGIRPTYLRSTTLRRGQNGARRACCRGFGPSSIGATGPPAPSRLDHAASSKCGRGPSGESRRATAAQAPAPCSRYRSIDRRSTSGRLMPLRLALTPSAAAPTTACAADGFPGSHGPSSTAMMRADG